MQEVTQASFAREPFGDGGMNLHRHAAQVETVVVFVHGLGGRGYRTWGHFPELLFSDSALFVDVAAYDYRSGLRSLRQGMGDWVDQLRGHLVDLGKKYPNVVLVGHSQGGLIAESAARRVFLGNMTAGHREPLAALFFLGAPRAGSRWVARPIGRLIPALGQLTVMNALSEENDAFYSSRVERHNLALSTGAIHFPTFAGIGIRDIFVDPLSTAFGVPESQRKRLALSHTRLSKPRGEASDLYRWVRDGIVDVLSNRAQGERLRAHEAAQIAKSPAPRAPGLIVTALLTDPGGLVFRDVYDDERAAASGANTVVMDVANAAGRTVDLVIAAHSVERIANAESNVQKSVQRVHLMRSSESARTGIVYPVGTDFAEAEKRVTEWLEQLGWVADLYVNGVNDREELRREIAVRFQRAIAENQPSPFRTLNIDPADRLESLDSVGGRDL